MGPPPTKFRFSESTAPTITILSNKEIRKAPNIKQWAIEHQFRAPTKLINFPLIANGNGTLHLPRPSKSPAKPRTSLLDCLWRAQPLTMRFG